MSAVADDIPVKGASNWRLALPALVAVVAWVLLCFHDTFLGIVEIWMRSETFTHGFVVPPIVLWLIWRRREHLRRVSPQPSPWGLLPLALAGFGWLLGDMAAVNAVTQYAATTLLVLAVVTVLGYRVAWTIAFPLAFLFFAVPFGEVFLPQLMEWTADFTILGLRLSGVPVYREGLTFVIPSGNWSVVEACSGVRYLIASLMVGTLFAYLNYQSFRKRTAFIIVSAVVPILANWFRAYMIVMLGHLSGNELAVGVDHLIYGWVFFGVVIMLMFAIGARWSDSEAPLVPVAGGEAVGLAWRLQTLLVPGVAALVIAWPQAANRFVEYANAAQPPRLALPDLAARGWQVQTVPPVKFAPAFDNPPAQAAGVFTKNGRSVGLFVGYYRNQTYAQKLVTSTNSLVKSTDPRWSLTESTAQALHLDGMDVLARRHLLVTKPTAVQGLPQHLRVWYWYWVAGRLTASDHEAKMLAALSRLRGQGDDAAVLILYALDEQTGEGDQALASFIGDAGPAIKQMLEQTRAVR